ncbi:MAG: hypothetical protein M3R35_08525, partial [Candidatus Eremiobacteraeota bacterium]|nr:hypothetical protein [Candidatus Eremiobacteraeota bacterium]
DHMIKPLFFVALVTALAIATHGAPAGAKPIPPAGGSNQRSSVEGCIGQTLFDGFWRFKVTKLETAQEPGYTNLPAWAVTIEMRNARSADSTAALLGVGNPELVLADSTVVEMSTGSEIAYGTQMHYKDLPPGASAHGIYYFRVESNTSKPAKLLLGISPANAVTHAPWGYPTHDPSFRVRLDCTK